MFKSIILMAAIVLSGLFMIQGCADEKTGQQSTETPDNSPATAIERSGGGSQPGDWLRNGRAVGSQIDEEAAMAFLFDVYDRKEKIATWHPAEDSAVILYLFQKENISTLITKTAFSAHYEDQGHPHFFLIMQTETSFDSCHACTVVLGGAIFHEIDGLWRLKTLNLAIGSAGCNGKAPANMSVVKVGPDLHAVVVRDGGIAQGMYQENYFLMGPVGDRLEMIFFLRDVRGENEGDCDSKLNNAGTGHECYAYDAAIHFIQGDDAEYYDLDVVIEGTKYNNDFSVSPFKNRVLYHFNGCRYTKGAGPGFSRDKPYFIQLGAFEKYRSADALLEKLSEAGYSAYCVFHKPDNANSFFRVRIGNYSTSREAYYILRSVQKLGFDGFVSK